MPRPKLIRQNEFPYHVTTRTNNKVPFPLPMYQVWDLAKQSLTYARKNVNVEINCFILMNNHYHLLITTPDENLDKFMMYFNLKFSKLISKNAKVINHKFSNRYKWTIVSNHEYLQNVYRYIYQNPLRANLVEKCIDYPYSSLYFTSFEGRLLNYRPHFKYADEVSYYEQMFSSNLYKIISTSMRRSVFKIPLNISKHDHNILKS